MYNCNFNRINSSDNLNLPQPDCCCPGRSRCCPRCCGRGPAGPVGPGGLRADPDPWGREGVPDLRDPPDPRDDPGQPVPPDPREGPDPREPWDLRDMWDPPGRREQPEPRDLPVCPGETEPWGPPGRRDRPGPTG